MISFNLTALNRETPLFQQKAKTRYNFPRKTLQSFTSNSFIVSTFNQISCLICNQFPPTTALRQFKRRAMAEMNSQFTIEEDQEMETQPIYLSSGESKIDLPCSSPIPQLANNVPDTYSAITKLIAQHKQTSLSGTFSLQYPTTPPTSLISDDDNDDVLTPISGNPAQFLPYIPNRHPIPLQVCQQITPIPDTPESPTPENREQADNFCPHDILDQPSSNLFNNPQKRRQ